MSICMQVVGVAVGVTSNRPHLRASGIDNGNKEKIAHVFLRHHHGATRSAFYETHVLRSRRSY